MLECITGWIPFLNKAEDKPATALDLEWMTNYGIQVRRYKTALLQMNKACRRKNRHIKRLKKLGDYFENLSQSLINDRARLIRYCEILLEERKTAEGSERPLKSDICIAALGAVNEVLQEQVMCLKLEVDGLENQMVEEDQDGM